jgi:hypothetical protein
MSLFHTSSSLTTINSIDNYISFFPCHISPSIINKRLFEINLKTLSSKYSSVGSNDLKNKKNDQENYEHSLVKRLYTSKNDSEALQMMSKLWKSVKFCDLIIMIGSVQYLAHRIVLALYSQKYRYFVHFGVKCSD